MEFLLIAGWLVLSLVVASAASARGRSAGAWLLTSLIFSPLVAVILLLAFPAGEPLRSPQDDAELQRNIRKGQKAFGPD